MTSCFHFETSAPNDPKMIESYKVKGTLYVWPISTSPKFQLVLLCQKPFLSYKPFSDKYTEWPQNDPEHYKVKCTLNMCYYSKPTPPRHRVPNFTHVLLYDNMFLSYPSFWETCNKWPSNNPKPYKIKCTSYVLLKSTSLKLLSVSLYGQSLSRYIPF